jgi:hypothetical protein
MGAALTDLFELEQMKPEYLNCLHHLKNTGKIIANNWVLRWCTLADAVRPNEHHNLLSMTSTTIPKMDV